MAIYYTMIGSRVTPPEIIELMTRFAEKACKFNYIGRSGGADGADACLEEGFELFKSDNTLASSGDYLEIYLPWKDFNGRSSQEAGYYTLSNLVNNKDAEAIAEKTHPAWDRCSQGAKKLHSRNVYQLLGQDLNTPSRFVICYAKPRNDGTNGVKGGTATAVQLGMENGVEIINLYHDSCRKRIEGWVNKQEETQK